MQRYSESRLKFPDHVDLPLTGEQKRRALWLAAYWEVPQNEAIRRCLDAHYLTIFSLSSIDQTMQPPETQ